MELLFVIVIGAGLGAIVGAAVPGRGAYGALLLPALGAAVSAAVWVGLLWAGLTFGGTWIWVASLGAGVFVTLATALLLPRRRTAGDAARLTELTRSGA